jgi:hypothetical protein
MQSWRFRVKRHASTITFGEEGRKIKWNHACKRVGHRKKIPERGACIQSTGGSSIAESHFNWVHEMKLLSAFPFLQVGKYYLWDQGHPSNYYSWREEIMRNIEKLKAMEAKKIK